MRDTIQKSQRDPLRYAANLIGGAVAVYFIIGLSIQGAVWGLAKLTLPATQTADAFPEIVRAVLRLLESALGLFLAVRFLRVFATDALRPKLRYTLPHDGRLWLFLPVYLGLGGVCSMMTALLQNMLARTTGYTIPPATTLPQSGGAVLFTFISMCVVPAVLEELLCRGMMQGLLRRWGVWFSVVVSSVVFTLLHSDIARMPAIFALSLVLGLIAHATDSLLPGMVLHFANNAAAFLFLLVEQRMQGVAAFGFSVYLLGVFGVCAVICLVLMVRLRMFAALQPVPRLCDAKNRQNRVRRLATAPLFLGMMLWLTLHAVLPLFAKG